MEFSTFVVLSTMIISYGMIFLVAVVSEQQTGRRFIWEAYEAVLRDEKWPFILLGIAFLIGIAVSVFLGALLNNYGREIVVVLEVLLFLWCWNVVNYEGKTRFTIVLTPDGEILKHKGLSSKQLACVQEKTKEILEIFDFCCKGKENQEEIIFEATCNKFFPLCNAVELEIFCKDKNGRLVGCYPEQEKREKLKKIFGKCNIKVLKIV